MGIGAAVDAVRSLLSQQQLNKMTKMSFIYVVAYGMEDVDFIPFDLMSAYAPCCGGWKSLTAMLQFGKLHAHLELCKAQNGVGAVFKSRIDDLLDNKSRSELQSIPEDYTRPSLGERAIHFIKELLPSNLIGPDGEYVKITCAQSKQWSIQLFLNDVKWRTNMHKDLVSELRKKHSKPENDDEQ